MTDLHDTIRAALAAATPGPWRSMRNGNQRIAEKDGRLQHVGASTVTGLPRAWNPAGIVADDPSVSRFTDADADLIASAPQWLAELLAECEALTVKRDRYLHALELVAPDGRGLQLFLGEGPAPGMPMYGSVCTESPYLIATKPEGPDAICLWAIVDPDAPKQVCRFRVYGTGHPLPDEPGVFIGTVQLHGGSLVFHVFEEAP